MEVKIFNLGNLGANNSVDLFRREYKWFHGWYKKHYKKGTNGCLEKKYSNSSKSKFQKCLSPNQKVLLETQLWKNLGLVQKSTNEDEDVDKSSNSQLLINWEGPISGFEGGGGLLERDEILLAVPKSTKKVQTFYLKNYYFQN